VMLKTNDLIGYVIASNTMIQDGGRSLEAWLRRLFARSIAWYEDYGFIQGSGVGQPQGMLNSGAAQTVSRNASSKFKVADAVAMAALMLPSGWRNAIWTVSITAVAQLLQLQDPTGGPQWTANLEAYGRIDMGTLYGQPVFPTEKTPALGTKGDVMFFGPSEYVIGDRETLEISVSFDSAAEYKKYQHVWRVLERIDGRPLFDKTITLVDGTTVVSPIVVLL